ncbi:flagellar biosynthesis regulator FlhF [Brachyspira catarrhinii]|uniref:Flagellar biosynthesis protein FlhF n=1 Tax=Brachyspira catarrhinii TaxID=2528966 RepID=A0ABY2TT79_9SPIR|nr:flagellar biosynthesis regulator FlhF [Brachyspira catarrhinii]TKZ36096.1 flagellar biosynthesis regulator FlhF [Brachyspira catarrhinii]
MALVDIKEFRAETKTEAYAKATVQYGSNFMLLKEWQEKPKGPLGLFKKPEWVVRVMPIGSHNRKSESKSVVKEYSNKDNDLDSYEDKLISDEKELNKHKYTTETIDGSEMGERIVDMIKRLKEAQYIKKSEVQSTVQSDTNNDIHNSLNLSPNIQTNNSPEKTINERIMDEKINNDRMENFNNNNFNNRIKNNNFNPLSSFNNSYNSSLFGNSMLSDSYYNRKNSIDENIKKMVESQVKDIVKEYFENNVPNFNRNKNIDNNNNNYYNRYESERSSINKTRYIRENREDFDFNNDIDDRRKDYRDDDRDNFENADAMEESFNYLRDREFPEETLLNLREYLLTSSNARFFQSNEIIREEIEKYFTNKLILSDGIDIGHKKKIIVFVGPTGVGKTTTIPKIAAQYIRSGRKVSFVTIDNYRIAAVDQLQRYASILKVPFTSASNPEALRAEIRKMDNSSLLFVDTMGRSPKGTDEIISMSKYFSTVGRFDMDIQLVMSSTAKYKDSVKILEAFKPANYKGIILTKVDETDYLASSVCAITGTKTPITYVTYGQGVPKDISTAKKYGIKIIESLYGNLK